jgi:transposase-like protein
MAMERMKDCPSVSALADELGIHRTILYQWQRKLEHSGEGSARVTCESEKKLEHFDVLVVLSAGFCYVLWIR